MPYYCPPPQSPAGYPENASRSPLQGMRAPLPVSRPASR
jgi:hypothetical protein